MRKLSKYEKKVHDYFAEKAELYDDVEKQTYWRLSDKLLWQLLSIKIATLKPDFRFLDVGGGTGRWSKKILEAFPRSNGTLVDMSEDMLAQAKEKNTFGDRWSIIHGDAQKIPLNDSSFDLVITFHNVLGFVENTTKAVREMHRVLKKGGLLISVVPNMYHAIFFNLTQKNIDEATTIVKKGRGRFVSNMPDLELFTPSKMTKIYVDTGLTQISCQGFPVAIYPGYQETQVTGESKVVDILAGKNFNRIYDIETKLMSNPDSAARGNNLFFCGRK